MIKKLLLSILLVLVLATPAFAVTSWYAGASCAAGNMSACAWNSTSTGSCTSGGGTTLSWNSQVAGDLFYANGCTGITVDVDPQGTGGSKGKVSLNTTAGSGTAGGTFLAVTSASPITITADINAGATTVLTVSGSANANPALTIAGNIYGSVTTTGAKVGLSTGHTVGTLVIGSVGTPVTIQGGTFADAAGMIISASGPVIIYSTTGYGNGVRGGTGSGNCQGIYATGGVNAVTINGDVSAYGGAGNGNNGLQAYGGTWTINGNIYASSTNTGGNGLATSTTGNPNATVNGDCIGSDSLTSSACNNAGTGKITVTGNLVNGLRGAANGSGVMWVPSSAQKYIKFQTTTGPTYIYASPGLGNVGGAFTGNAATEAPHVGTGYYFVGPDSASYTQGSMTASGSGGSYGF